MLSQERILEVFGKTKVMLNGHFLLTSGRHSDRYMQCARLFEYPDYSEELCSELARRFSGQVDVVAGPALGGIIMAYEVARGLRCRNIFAERENGIMTFRRNFRIEPGERVLVTEDVVTTGGSVREVMALVEAAGGKVAGVACIVDRSAGAVDFGCRLEALLSMEIKSYAPEECPLCAKGLPLVKPGSRTASK